MPLFLHDEIEPAGELGLWRITETEDWFLAQLDLTPPELEQARQFKSRRRLEWLAARLLVHQMSGRDRREVMMKDDFGKPYLENSGYFLSISHSAYLAAAIAAPRPAGIDVQRLVGKIDRLAHRFMGPEELASLEPATRLYHLHVYWGAKEALYKAYGRRRLDFREHIFITPFAYNPAGVRFHGRIAMDGFSADYDVRYEQHGEYVLVYAVER